MATIQDLYELSPMQQGMLFHTLYAPETGIYFEQRHCLVRGNLNRTAFKQAWRQVVNRHGVLRTEFHWQETDKPLQVVFDTIELPWIEGNWQIFSKVQQTEKLETFLAQDRAQGFQLDQAPLMRCALFKLESDQYRFVWSYHHLLMDGWCNGVLIKEVLAIYQAICQGVPLQLPTPKPYRDYIVWLQQQDQTQAELYWRQILQGFSAPTPLGVARADVGVSESYCQQQVYLPVALSTDLQAFAQQFRLTLNTLFQGAWAIVLSRYSGLSDILFGVTISGRPSALSSVESMVGLFINTAPLRSHLPHDTILLPWLQQLQQDQRDRETYGYSALTDLHSWSDVPRDTPLFESLLVFENYPISIESAIQDRSMDLSLQDGQGYEQTNYPLTLVVIPGDVLKLSLRYKANRISEMTAQRLLGHLEVVLGSFVANPEQPLGQLPLLKKTEQQRLQLMAQSTTTQISPNCIHQLFEAQVESAPDAVAVVFESQQLTYRELNQRANQLAHYLQELGVKPETLVGICVERSLDMVVGVLGILKAGGAYAPLDPSYPQQRLQLLLDDTQAPVLLTQVQLLATLPKHVARVVCLDRDWSAIAQFSSENLHSGATANNLAYVIYTSGSTGAPKGVLISHQNISRLFSTTQAIYNFNAQDCWTLFHSYAFDFSVWELWGALLHGGCLVIVSYWVSRSPEKFHTLLARHQVTVLNQTPSAFRQLIQADKDCPANGLRLRYVIFGGEALSVQSLSPWFDRHGDERPQLVNMYGITETTVHVTHRPLNKADLEQASSPIGTALPDLQVYILDSYLRPVPIGVAGELYIGGAGVARGYLNRPELTAEKFIANPFGPDRLYKTGDRARYREDGSLEYLGRLDDQIKLRGFRIEPGEIETALTQHPKIDQAIVIISDQDNPQLVAYLTLTEQISTDILIDQLRRWLSQRLPAYMIPTAYVVLEALPLTSNGKVDRRLLPAPERVAHKGAEPRTPMEILIAGIWATVLDYDAVSLEDHFFELGGHSLLATRVIAQVRQVFGVEAPLRSLFEHPILADFIAVIQQAQGQQVESVPRIQPIPGNSQLTLSYAQQRQWLMHQLDSNSRAYTIAAAIRLSGELSIEGLRQSLTHIISRHDPLRTVYPSVEGMAAPTVTPASEAKIELIDLSHLNAIFQQSEVKQQIQQQVQQRFNLAQGPLWRAHLLRLSEQMHILLLIFHHIVTDGWSMGVLLKELTALYHAFQAGKAMDSVLPPLPICYGDYAVWQKSLDLEAQLTYWQRQLNNIPPLLELPTDYPRPAESSWAGAAYDFHLSQQQTAELQRFGRQNGVTLFMTLLAAFKVLLYRYSGISDVVVGSPIANRQQAELEGLIGLFVNTLVMRTQLAGNPRFVDLLTQVRTVALEAYRHQDLPFEQLVNELSVPRSRSHTPLFQVMFVLQNAPLEAISLELLDWSPLRVDTGAAKFDITLQMRETPNGMAGMFEYRSDLFSAATIQRMAGHFQALLKGLPDNGRLRLSELPMLSPLEHQQLQAWRQMSAPQPLTQKCIHQLFEAQVEATPGAIALVHNQTLITYQDLNQRANQLACYLQQQGVGPETKIGVWAERSLQIILAILAILKAGGAYVPLDPNYPTERLNWMVQDTQMALLLADRLVAPIPLAVQTIDLAAIADRLADQSTANLSVSVEPNNLAYILYTSGSTGRPKGVCTPHQGVTRLVRDPSYVTLDHSDVLLQAAPLTFDASTFEIWGALLNGGKLVLLSPPSPSLADLGQAIVSNQITTLWLTSGLFNLMVDEHLDTLKSLRQLLAGGDVLSVSHLRKASATLENTRIINGYGPTEGTTFTCCHIISDKDLATNPPIGYPLHHTQIYVLDANLQQLPVGLPGELYIGGAGLARGYLNRPDLTAEQFIPNPFYDIRQSASDSVYLYKTGDRVCYRADGALEYLGRLDQQVKVRGFRIEPGEIEAALASHPDIQQAVVVVDGETADQKRLVAYLQSAQPPHSLTPPFPNSPTPLALRQFLLEKLPDYMAPAKFIWLDLLPLTPNGKVDRRALPAPQWENSDLSMPQTEVEKTLAEIWSVLLRTKSVGVNDNFFDLGGDSILAMQIVSRAAQAGVAISPKQLFQHQTIAELAAVAQPGNGAAISPTPAIGQAPLTPIQHWFFEQALTAPHHFNQSVSLELPMDVNQCALDQAFAQIYQHHDALRLRFILTDQGWLQQFSDAPPPTITWFDLTHLSPAAQDDRIVKQGQVLQTSLNLQEGPLVSIVGFDLGDSRPSQLFIAIHHLVIDGVSWRILMTDLQQTYQQAVLGEPLHLASRTHTYQQWANQLAQTAHSPAVEANRPYWLTVVQTQLPNLPQDKAGGENTVESMERVAIALSSDQTQSLLQAVPRVYNTQINDALLTALTLTLLHWTGNSSILIDLESHGRFSDELDLSRTVGWFTCLYPICLSLDLDASLAVQLKAIKAQLQAVPDQGLSYGLLRYLRGQSDLAIAPAIGFNYLGQLDTVNANGFRRIVSPGSNQAAGNICVHQIDISCWVEAEQLHIEWAFSCNDYQGSTIDTLAQQFADHLSALIDHCLSKEDVDYSPEDFNLVQLDQAALNAVLGQVSFIGDKEASQ